MRLTREPRTVKMEVFDSNSETRPGIDRQLELAQRDKLGARRYGTVPPLTLHSAPVTYDERFEHRNTTAAATSSG
jgi:hypothetical protein